MIDKLAAIPLAAQPGTDWRYGPSVNIQGYIVEKLSGMPLDEFLAKRIFSPLKMNDTGFWVEPSKLGRVSRLHTYGPDKRITSAPDLVDVSKKPVFLSGSGGLLSTAEDYWRFSQMLLNGGQLDGARLLKRQTVALMRTNVLAPGVKVDTFVPLEGIGFGLDFAIVMDPAAFGSSSRPQHVLLGRRVRDLVLDRSDQRRHRRRDDPEHQRQRARWRLAARASLVTKARVSGAERPDEIAPRRSGDHSRTNTFANSTERPSCRSAIRPDRSSPGIAAF